MNKNEIKNNSTYNSIKKNKIFRNKFNKINNLYTESYKTLLKEIKDLLALGIHSGPSCFSSASL